MRHSNTLWMLAIVTAIFVLIFLNLVLGSVSIPLQSVWHIIWNLENEPITWQNIIWKSRLPQALTALVAGAGLSISGLQMQTVFRNPLAGPSVLGISSGASMGVAWVVLLSGAMGGVALSSLGLSIILISEPTRPYKSSYAIFCLKKKKNTRTNQRQSRYSTTRRHRHPNTPI